MAYSLTIAGYTFDNPPENYRKQLTLGNSPVPMFKKQLSRYYQSDQQELQFEVEGRLSLNEQDDLDELERLQRLAIDGGEVRVEFDPFFSGQCVIEDDPFQQSDERGRYRFILTVNEDNTDGSAYPAHATPTTGNTFKLGSFDFGYDPQSLEQNYERQTTTVDRLQGVSQSTDNAGLVTKVTIDGNTDGGGLKALWDKARNNELSYLEAEFQNGWALIGSLSVGNNEAAPDYLTGLFRYTVDLFVVSDPEGGVGEVSSYIDHAVKDTGTYVSDSDAGTSDFSGLEFTVNDGSGSINGEYVTWSTTTLTLNDNATNWVYADDADGDGQGAVKFNNSGFPADGVELYRVYTSGGEIVTIEDVRAQLIKDNDSDAGDSTSEKDGTDLYYTVAGGTSPDDPNGQETTWIQTTHKLALNSTNYLFVEDPNSDGDGDVAINQSGYPANTVSLWRVVTDGDSITNEIDDRPTDLKQGGSGDTSDSDLVFQTDMVIDDSGFDFARILSLSEALNVSPSVLFTGLLDFADSVAVDDPAPSWKGIATLSESVSVVDGGSGGGATDSVRLTTDVSLNGGSGSLTVYEDTSGDGNADNTETVSLNGGATDYDLNNLTGGSGNDYWVDLSLDDTDNTSSPVVHSVTVNTAASSDDDQNPNTEWTILGGVYERSGNEYEGGGVVTTYAQ